MFTIFFKALRVHVWLRILLSAFVLSTIGSGLTYVVVFTELIALNAPPSSLALTFVFATAPGILGTFLGNKLLKKLDASLCIVLAEAMSLVGLLVPLVGVAWHNVALLQMSALVGTIVGGMVEPIIGHYVKAKLQDEELGSVAVMDTLMHGCHVLLGIGVGVCLYPWVQNPYLFLGLDALSYGLSMMLLLLLPKLYTDYRETPIQPLPRQLSFTQKLSLNLLPLLASVGAPAMALLPSLIPTAMHPKESVLPILFARSLGQLFGPFFIQKSHLNQPPVLLMMLCLVGFLGSYVAVTLSNYLWLSLFLIFFAHILSNIVASLGGYGLLKHFDAKQVVVAITHSYRKQMVVVAVTSTVAGLLADDIGAQQALFICSGGGLLLAILALGWLRRQDRYQEKLKLSQLE